MPRAQHESWQHTKNDYDLPGPLTIDCQQVLVVRIDTIGHHRTYILRLMLIITQRPLLPKDRLSRPDSHGKSYRVPTSQITRHPPYVEVSADR